jgi:hypothetical protein
MGHWQQPLLGDFESVLVQLGLSKGLLIILFTIGEVADERKGLLVIFAHDQEGDERLSEVSVAWSRLFLSQPVAFSNARASTILDKIRAIPRPS